MVRNTHITVPENKAEAIRWYRMAAEGGNAEAQLCLGIKYDNGDGLPQSKDHAKDWYTRAARQGYSTAQVVLGIQESGSNDGPSNPTEALRWFNEAANNGDAAAQYILGQVYSGEWRSRWDVPVNYSLAVRWYKSAGEQGHEEAQSKYTALHYGEYNFPVRTKDGRWSPEMIAEFNKRNIRGSEREGFDNVPDDPRSLFTPTGYDRVRLAGAIRARERKEAQELLDKIATPEGRIEAFNEFVNSPEERRRESAVYGAIQSELTAARSKYGGLNHPVDQSGPVIKFQRDQEERFQQLILGKKRDFEKYAKDDGKTAELAASSRKASTPFQQGNIQHSPIPNSRQSPGAIDVTSGQFFPRAGAGVVDPRNGTYYHEVGGGFVNTRTGIFVPAH